MRIALIGTGNVAWHLAQVCTKAGHELVAVVGRNADTTQTFAAAFSTMAYTNLAALTAAHVDIVLIAVPDAAIAVVAESLKVNPGTIVAHTSGSQPISLLKSITGAKTGVFYPVQTFTKYKPLDFASVPVLIEGSDIETVRVLQQLAETLSTNVQEKDSDARKKLHLAAVFACNFTNHLFGISQTILKEGGLPTDLLQPLIAETIAKAETNQPFQVQTGPASRNDVNVIEAHLHMLQNEPTWHDLYLKLTESIQNQQQKGTSGI